MTNVEELQRALDYPWEKWTVFLHPEQRQIVEREYAGPSRVSGSAGIDFFLREYPSQPDKTRACVEMSLAGLLRPFSLSPLLRKLFCGETNIDPNALIEEGKILVCDLPINRDRQVGRLANALWKTAFQMAVEQREDSLGDAMRPVFLRLEEGQELFTVQDTAFQAKCRSSRCATCFITQNLPGMYARTNGDKYAVDSFFGNLSTHIYHSNSDVDSCEYMSRQLGKSRRLRVAGSPSEKSWADKWLGGGGGGKSNDLSLTSDLSPNVFPDEFRRLKRGGPPDYEATAYVLLMGKTFSTGRHYALVSFSQRPPSDSNDEQDSPLSSRPRTSRSLTLGLPRFLKSILSLGSWLGFGPNAKR